MVRKIVEKVPDNQLLSDLERYKEEAIRLGATDAKVIERKDIIIDERAYAKCLVPKCPFFGTNVNCPPYGLKPEETRRIVERYRYGVLFTIQAPSDTFVGDFKVLTQKGEIQVHRMKVYEIASKVESMAFYDGYYFALGLGSGPCKAAFCKDVQCVALEPGKPCPFSLKARPSLEGMGMDAYGISTRMGWDIYPCGASASPEDIPFGRRLGLVLIY